MQVMLTLYSTELVFVKSSYTVHWLRQKITNVEMFLFQLTFSSTVSMDERLVYSPDPSDSEKTILRQETIITVKGVPLTSYMEGYLLNSISSNSFKVSSDF